MDPSEYDSINLPSSTMFALVLILLTPIDGQHPFYWPILTCGKPHDDITCIITHLMFPEGSTRQEQKMRTSLWEFRNVNVRSSSAICWPTSVINTNRCSEKQLFKEGGGTLDPFDLYLRHSPHAKINLNEKAKSGVLMANLEAGVRWDLCVLFIGYFRDVKLSITSAHSWTGVKSHFAGLKHISREILACVGMRSMNSAVVNYCQWDWVTFSRLKRVDMLFSWL